MNPSQKRFKEVLTEAFPAGEPSLQLRERVASGVYTQQSARQDHRRQALRLVGATVVAIACGVGFLNWTRWVSAEPLRQMQAALEKVETVYQKIHMTEPMGESAQWDDIKTGWVRRLNRETGPDGALQVSHEELIRDGERWLYNHTGKEVTHQKYVPGPYSKRSGFTITDIRRDLMKSTGEYASFTDLGSVTKDSRPARKYRLVHNESGNVARFEFYVDPQTNLPFHGEIYALRRGEDQWKLYGTVDLTYNATPPTDTFALNFPKTVPWRDLDRERDAWRAQLEKGIARKKTESGRPIVVRYFHVSPEGDVLVLYTAGPLSKDGWTDWQTTLTDDQGTTYQSYSGSAIMGVMQNGKPTFPGTVYDGVGLVAEGWIATIPQPTPWQARTFTLTFKCKPQNQSTENVSTSGRKETTSFTLPVAASAETLFPPFLSQLPWPYNSEGLEKARARVRGELEPGVKPSSERVAILTGVNDTVQSLAFSPDGRTLVSGAWKDSVRLWDVATGKQTGSWNTGITGVSNLAFTSDGQRIALSGMVFDGRRYTENRIQMRGFPTGNQIWQQRIIGEDYGSTAISLSPDGSQLHGLGSHIDGYEYKNGEKYTAHMSSRLWAWNARTGTLLREKRGQPTKFGENQAFLDTRTGREVKLPPTEPGTQGEQINFSGGMAISEDEMRIAATGREMKGKNTLGPVLFVWDTATGKRLHLFRTSGFSIDRIAFSPDGNYIAGTSDHNILLWDLKTGRLQKTLVGHGSPVMELAFSPDGSLLASGDLKGGIMLWRIPERL